MTFGQLKGNKTHQIQEPMKKSLTCSKRFHNFRQVEAANEVGYFLVCTGTYAKKSTRGDFSLGHLN